MELLGAPRLDLDQHISNISKTAGTQLNFLKILKAFVGFKENRFLFRALYLLILIIILWCGILYLQNHYRKLKSYKNAL